MRAGALDTVHLDRWPLVVANARDHAWDVDRRRQRRIKAGLSRRRIPSPRRRKREEGGG
jgi:hypothetical protein